MPKFDLVLGRSQDSADPITLVKIAEGEFSGVLLDIQEVKVTADQQLVFTYNLHEYTGNAPDMKKLDAVVEEIVYLILENMDQGEDASEN